MKTMLLRVVPLTLTYAILTEPLSIGNWLVALAFATPAALAPGARLSVGTSAVTRLAGLPWLIWGSIRNIVHGSWRMLPVLLGLRTWQGVGFVEVRQAAETPAGLALLALIHSASPGSVAAEIERKTRTITFSLLDAREPARREVELRDLYRRYQRRGVP